MKIIITYILLMVAGIGLLETGQDTAIRLVSQIGLVCVLASITIMVVDFVMAFLRLIAPAMSPVKQDQK